MENREQQILSEIRLMMDAIKGQLELMESKMAELQQLAGNEDADVSPIDLDIDDDLPFYEHTEPVEEPVEEPEPAPEVVPESVSEVEMATEPELEQEPEQPEVELVMEDLPEPEPVMEAEADVVVEVVEEAVKVEVTAPKQAVIDAMTERQAWRHDMPGSQVRDIRSAISLNDRILFINWLFSEDPMAFQDALTKINQMTSLDEAVAFVTENYPQWDMESDVVYRFMMAVRRKVN